MNLRKSKVTAAAKPKTEWAATSTKRKRIYDDATDAITSRRVIAKMCDDKNEPPEESYSFTPQKKKEAPPCPPGPNTTIHWEERRTQRETYPNTRYVDTLLDLVMESFKTLARKFGREPGELGPNILWHLLPAVMEGVQNTPWEYYANYEEWANDPQECLCFIHYTYGDRGQDLSINQNKFRKVVLSALKEKLMMSFTVAFPFPVSVVFSKKFFDSI
jgi:hypothetical protein